MLDSRRGTIGAVWSHHRRPFLNGAKTGPAHHPSLGGIWGSERANPWGSLGAGTPRKPLGGERGDIGAVATAWPELPKAIKAGIEAMVKAAAGKDGGHSLSEDGVPRPAQFTRPPRQTELETCGRL